MEELRGYDEWKTRSDRDEYPDEEGDRPDGEPDARDLFNMLPSDGAHVCPDCNSSATHPEPGCNCPTEPTKFGRVTRHINRYHHTCAPERGAGREE